jgi:hypothetical protein
MTPTPTPTVTQTLSVTPSITNTPTPTPTSILCDQQFCVNITLSDYQSYNGTYNFIGNYNSRYYWSGGAEPGYIFYDSNKWCLSNSLGGDCVIFGNETCDSPCPDFDPTVLVSGPCPTPTPTPTPTNSSTPTTTPTPSLSNIVSTPTPTPSITPSITPTNICGGVGAIIITGTTIPVSPTPSVTPSPTASLRVTVTGSTDYIINNGYFQCGDVAFLTECDGSEVFYVNTPITYSGGTISVGQIFTATISGLDYCLTYVEDVSGSSSHIIQSIGGVIEDCDSCPVEPSPTPTITPTPSITPSPII